MTKQSETLCRFIMSCLHPIGQYEELLERDVDVHVVESTAIGHEEQERVHRPHLASRQRAGDAENREPRGVPSQGSGKACGRRVQRGDAARLGLQLHCECPSDRVGVRWRLKEPAGHCLVGRRGRRGTVGLCCHRSEALLEQCSGKR